EYYKASRSRSLQCLHRKEARHSSLDAEAMVGSTITSEMISEGAALLQALDKEGASPDAAFWLYLPESGTWRLFLAEFKLGKRGPREEYRFLQRVLRKLEERVSTISLTDITVG